MSLKVIGGRLKGKPLASAKGWELRPTAGLVRGAIFNILGPRIQEAVVLDLFAGTGALGIEALSRGASRAVFVDHSPASLAIIKSNIHSCGLESAATTLRQDATRNLSGLTGMGPVFDLVFMDPPYDHKAVNSALISMDNSGVLKPGALVVAEHSPREPIQTDSGPYVLRDERKYGRTIVSFLEYMLDYSTGDHGGETATD